MKRAVNTVLGVILAVILICSLALYAYRVELVLLVVKNDMAQKAPDHYPKARINEAFEQARRQMQAGALSKDDLLQKLFDLSQRLEKTQYLAADEADRMLETLKGSPESRPRGAGSGLSH